MIEALGLPWLLPVMTMITSLMDEKLIIVDR